MSGAGAIQHLGRLGSTTYIPVRSEPVDAGDGSLELPCASPSKKKSGLLKGLKKIGTLLSGHASVSSGGGSIRPDSDPSRNGLAHALSTPDMPAAIPASVPASPSPSYHMDMGRVQRFGLAFRSGAIGSPPIEPHSPCSPFPSAGRSLVHQNYSARSDDASLRCVLDSCTSPTIAMPFHQQHPHQQLQLQQPRIPRSPVGVASPPASTSSPYDSGGSGSGRLEKVAGDPSNSPRTASQACTASISSSPSSASTATTANTAATSPLARSPSAACPSVASPPSHMQSPHAPSGGGSAPHPHAASAPVPGAAASAPATPPVTLLALNPAVPGSMRRRSWSLEDYQVIKRLYKGGSASVYKATCLRSGLPVALKVYFLTKVPRNVVHMIKREIELHHRLVHPNIIQLYAAFLDGDRIVLVQEYAARGDLFHLLRQMGGRMTETQVSDLVMRPFLEAMAYLHSHGVCHRDIKPENILYNDRWVLKVADFGVSINLNEERAVTRAGTIDYMAPEVTRCPLKAEPSDNKDDPNLAYTSAVDIWAAGVLAYELLVGFTPVLAASPQGGMPASASDSDIGRFMAAEATARALHFPASLSPPARHFILGALSEVPCDRPTAKELLRHPWLAGPGTAAAAAAAVPGAAARGGSPSSPSFAVTAGM